MNTKTELKILLLGDSCTDVYQYGTVERINPEAPVPIFQYSHQESKLGMAGNVLLNLQALGCKVKFITNSEYGIKTRLIDIKSKQQMLRIDNDNISEPLDLNNFNDWDYNAIVISDYNKGAISYELIEHIIDHYNGPIFIDTKKTDLARFKHCFLKINEIEYKARKSDGENIIVTLGNKGAMLKTKSIEKMFPTQVKDVTDVCGAGDTFLSALTYYYLKDCDIEKAIEFANIAAKITVQHIGVYAPSLQEILENKGENYELG